MALLTSDSDDAVKIFQDLKNAFHDKELDAATEAKIQKIVDCTTTLPMAVSKIQKFESVVSGGAPFDVSCPASMQALFDSCCYHTRLTELFSDSAHPWEALAKVVATKLGDYISKMLQQFVEPHFQELLADFDTKSLNARITDSSKLVPDSLPLEEIQEMLTTSKRNSHVVDLVSALQKVDVIARVTTLSCLEQVYTKALELRESWLSQANTSDVARKLGAFKDALLSYKNAMKSFLDGERPEWLTTHSCDDRLKLAELYVQTEASQLVDAWATKGRGIVKNLMEVIPNGWEAYTIDEQKEELIRSNLLTEGLVTAFSKAQQSGAAFVQEIKDLDLVTNSKFKGVHAILMTELTGLEEHAALLITCAWFMKRIYIEMPSRPDKKQFLRDLRKRVKNVHPPVPVKLLALLTSA